MPTSESSKVRDRISSVPSRLAGKLLKSDKTDLFESLTKKAIQTYKLQDLFDDNDSRECKIIFWYVDAENDVLTIASHEELMTAILEEIEKPAP